MTAKQVLMWSLFLYLISILVGLYLVVARGLTVLWLGIAGVFIAFFSSAPPFKLSYRGHGLGELVTGIGCGPLIVIGSYYVQALRITREAVWASIPMGLLGAALIWINQLPDYEADKTAGKHTLAVVFGRQRAAWGYVALLVAVYGVIVIGVALGVLSTMLLLALLSLPLAYKAARGAIRFHSDTPRLIPTSAATIQLYLANGLLLCLGYGIARFL